MIESTGRRILDVWKNLVGEKDPVYWNFEFLRGNGIGKKLSGLLSRNRVVSREDENEFSTRIIYISGGRIDRISFFTSASSSIGRLRKASSFEVSRKHETNFEATFYPRQL